MQFFPLHQSIELTLLQSEILLLFSLVPYNHVRLEHGLVVFMVYDTVFTCIFKDRANI